MTLSRSPRGINVRRYLEDFGIRVCRTSQAKPSDRRPANTIYGRARTVARLMKQDKDRLSMTLRCIQASDPTALQADVILAVFRFLGAHMPTMAPSDAVVMFRGVSVGEIRDRVVGLAKGQDGLTHAAKVEGIYFLLADRWRGDN